MANRFREAKTELEIILGHNFVNEDILREALWAAGPGSVGHRLFPEGNKRLALVGDAALKIALVHHSYTKGRSRGMSDGYISLLVRLHLEIRGEGFRLVLTA